MSLLNITYRIDKESKTVYREGLAGRPKIEIIFLDKDLFITKESGYSDWVDRCTGLAYSPSNFRIAKVLSIKNYNKSVYIDTKEIERIDVKDSLKNEKALDWLENNIEITEPTYSKQRLKKIEFIKQNNKNMLSELE